MVPGNQAQITCSAKTLKAEYEKLKATNHPLAPAYLQALMYFLDDKDDEAPLLWERIEEEQKLVKSSLNPLWFDPTSYKQTKKEVTFTIYQPEIHKKTIEEVIELYKKNKQDKDLYSTTAIYCWIMYEWLKSLSDVETILKYDLIKSIHSIIPNVNANLLYLTGSNNKGQLAFYYAIDQLSQILKIKMISPPDSAQIVSAIQRHALLSQLVDSHHATETNIFCPSEFSPIISKKTTNIFGARNSSSSDCCPTAAKMFESDQFDSQKPTPSPKLELKKNSAISAKQQKSSIEVPSQKTDGPLTREQGDLILRHPSSQPAKQNSPIASKLESFLNFKLPTNLFSNSSMSTKSPGKKSPRSFNLFSRAAPQTSITEIKLTSINSEEEHEGLTLSGDGYAIPLRAITSKVG